MIQIIRCMSPHYLCHDVHFRCGILWICVNQGIFTGKIYGFWKPKMGLLRVLVKLGTNINSIKQNKIGAPLNSKQTFAVDLGLPRIQPGHEFIHVFLLYFVEFYSCSYPTRPNHGLLLFDCPRWGAPRTTAATFTWAGIKWLAYVMNPPCQILYLYGFSSRAWWWWLGSRRNDQQHMQYYSYWRQSRIIPPPTFYVVYWTSF